MRRIARFEAWVRGMLEGHLGAWLGARLEPVDITRQLTTYMDSHLTLGSASRYAPNAYRVYLAPRAMAAFQAFRQALADELAAGAVAHAQVSGYRFLGRVRVALQEDESLAAHRVRIEADVIDRAALTGTDHGATSALTVAAATDHEPAAMALVWLDRRFALPVDREAVVGIGRALDNAVILGAETVSRHHARLTPRGGAWLLEDLGSTHGTAVNGRRVTTALVRAGDRIEIGGERLVLAADGR